MGLTKLERFISGDEDLDIIQRNIAECVDPLTRVALLDGVLLADVALVSGAFQNVPHKLGRKPMGWVVVRKNANADVWEDTGTAATKLSDKLLALRPSANVTVSLWVF